MNFFIILAIVVFVALFFIFKWNNFRTKIAFLFIFLGVGFALLFTFFVFVKEKSDLSSVDSAINSFKTYLAWLWSSTAETMKTTGYTIREEVVPKVKGWFGK